MKRIVPAMVTLALATTSVGLNSELKCDTVDAMPLPPHRLQDSILGVIYSFEIQSNGVRDCASQMLGDLSKEREEADAFMQAIDRVMNKEVVTIAYNGRNPITNCYNIVYVSSKQ